eukprot:CAMPEP_0178525444 /NCGR_PEP_ID=MMETSP0696-20121128/30184_1 /TAXON_ID=265572 /ORGANISM="Extubocellulus spinifer, Strain CCMP396" /LENGTH=426 /DNA_ID=CAMNT_0020156855 /DNA_START=204 /DNA_END=1484 /DNA_ORIENTATION=-
MSAFTLNEQVNVESRTWPGINKPGGVGKIVKIHSEGTTIVAVDVKYVLGGTEKDVELQYVKRHEELNRGGRPRSRRSVMNLGDGGEEEGSRSSAKPKRSAASPGAAKKSGAKKGTNNRAKASSGNKRKTTNGYASSKKACKAKKKKAAQTPSSAILPSDSDSVVVSADESELTAPSHKPVVTKKATAKKSSSKATANKGSNIVPQDKPPPIAAGAVKLAPMASKKATQLPSQGARPMPKLKKTDKNASTVTAGGSKVQATLQKVHESNSRAASCFVDAIVGGAAKEDAAAAEAAADSASDDASTIIVGDDQSTIGGNTHSSSASLTVDTQRRQLFCTKLNEVMIQRMVEEMSIDDILAKVNAAIQDQKPSSAAAASGGLFEVGDKKSGGTDPTRSFTNLEIRSYLNELDRQQKIMVTWDTGTVYKI